LYHLAFAIEVDKYNRLDILSKGQITKSSSTAQQDCEEIRKRTKKTTRNVLRRKTITPVITAGNF